MAAYYGGSLRFSTERYGAVLEALNLITSKRCAVVVGHAVEEGGVAALPLAVKCADAGGVAELNGACTVEDVRAILGGEKLKLRRLAPSLDDERALKVARELEGAEKGRELAMEQILPRRRAGADRPFSGLPGMEAQAKSVAELLRTAKEYGRGAVCLHTLLVGAPGTGKTTFAREAHALGSRLGVTPGDFVECRAEDLVAPYVGQTAERVHEAWRRARGGTLFIDEAYKLVDTQGYGIEALNALNELMEAERGDVAVVCAGYPDQMRLFIDSNPGFESRFGLRLAFPGYDAATLARIVRDGFAAGLGLEVDARAEETLLDACQALVRGEGYGNARSARKLFDRWLVKQACAGGGRVLSVAALDAARAEAEAARVGEKRPLGFA